MEKLKYLTGKKLKEIISHKNLFQLFIIETIIKKDQTKLLTLQTENIATFKYINRTKP